MLRRKDNLTDLVEHLPKERQDFAAAQEGNQEVTDTQGEIVILSQKPEDQVVLGTNKNVLELSVIESVVHSAVEESLDDFVARHKKNKDE